MILVDFCTGNNFLEHFKSIRVNPKLLELRLRHTYKQFELQRLYLLQIVSDHLAILKLIIIFSSPKTDTTSS